MKVGDLVRHRPGGAWGSAVPVWIKDIGIILEIRNNEENPPDYRTEDAVLVLWAGGHDWSWRSELELTHERR